MSSSLAGKNTNRPKMANIELLRCIAMMMVVVLHYLGKSSLLADLTKENMGSVGVAAWVLESFCIVAFNLYMLFWLKHVKKVQLHTNVLERVLFRSFDITFH